MKNLIFYESIMVYWIWYGFKIKIYKINIKFIQVFLGFNKRPAVLLKFQLLFFHNFEWNLIFCIK